MKSIRASFALAAMVIAGVVGAYAQIQPYRVTDRQVQTVLDRIDQRSKAFERRVDRSLDRSSVDGTAREDSINTLLDRFTEATSRLRNNFSSRRSTAEDVREVLNRAIFINNFVAASPNISRAAKNEWAFVKSDIDVLAGYYSVAPDWTMTPGTGGTGYGDRDIQNLVERLKSDVLAFRVSYQRWERYNRRNRTDDISRPLTDLDAAINRLDNRVDRNPNANRGPAVEAVLTPSAEINSFLNTNRTNVDVANKWRQVRTDLDQLARFYNVSWDWNRTTTPFPVGGSFDSSLTGTYRLNMGLSDNVSTMVDRAIINARFNENQRDRVRRNLERRLTAPATITLEKRGRQVMLSSPNGSMITLEADGVARTETSPNGRTVRTTVSATNRDVTINYEGDRMNDYYVSFMPTNNGQLRVTRRIYLEGQNDQVTVTSVYDKVSQSPDWNTTAGYPTNNNWPAGSWVIPNNTGLVATLDTPLSTRASQDGDRFRMTVTSPSQYRGAIIEGRVVAERSGVVTGRAKMTLSFDTIRMSNGQTYRFAGIVDQVREPDGDVVSVSNEGTLRDDSQTTKTVTRAGIGAVLGALIGAIAGGGEGAAIGAGVGAGAGAGTVILQGRDNLELGAGSQFTITATAPANAGTQ